MKLEDKAQIILEHLDEVININWAIENTSHVYTKAIIKALERINQEE